MPVIEVTNIPTVVEPTFAPSVVEATEDVALVEVLSTNVQVEFQSAATLVPGSHLTGGGYMIGNVPINLTPAAITSLTNADTALQPGDNADLVGYEPFGSGLMSTNVQDAIDELKGLIGTGGGGGGTLTTVVGTANQINVNNVDPANPVLSLAAPVLASLALANTGVQPAGLTAAATSYNHTTSGLAAITVQAAIDELVSDPPVMKAPETRIASFTGGNSAIFLPTNNVPINIREDCVLSGIVILTTEFPGNCQIDIWKSSFGAYPPTVANSICGGTLPSITAGQTYSDFTLTGWTTSFSAGDTLLVKLNSSTIFKIISVFLIFTPVNSTPLDGYTDERARDVIGAALTDTATVNLTHDDALNQIKADVITSGLDLVTSAVRGLIPPPGTPTGRVFSDSLGWVDPGILSGTLPWQAPTSFTPTYSVGTNVGTIFTSAHSGEYHIIGDWVFVHGTIQAQSTTAGINSSLVMTLPVPSDTTFSGGAGFPLRMHGHGSAQHGTSAPFDGVTVGPNGSADQALIVWIPDSSSTTYTIYYSFTYKRVSTVLSGPAVNDSQFGDYSPAHVAPSATVTNKAGHFTRMGNIVTVSLTFDIAVTGAGAWVVQTALPVASALTLAAQVKGTGSVIDTAPNYIPGRIRYAAGTGALSGQATAEFTFNALTNTTYSCSMIYQYKVQ